MAFLSRSRVVRCICLFLGVLIGVLAYARDRPVALSLTEPNPTALEQPVVEPLAASALTRGVTKTVLENGLTVLTKEVHTAPVVSVQVWYKVGSGNEGDGENGISHQLEHLMFKGTRDRPIQFGRLFSALGSEFNAFTSYDETVYWGTVERDKLDALITLEADRMQQALVNADHLASEKRVVISELQGYENSPSYRLNRAVLRAAFPEHSYGLPVGGTKADVEAFTVEQVHHYYQTYYNPNNAVLVITGDFATESALETVRQTFGPLSNRHPAAPISPSNSQALTPAVPQRAAARSPQPLVLREPGSAALLQTVYPLPGLQHPDVPAIDLMDMILTGGRNSRLHQALVESGLASSVSAYPMELLDLGWYEISVTAAPGQDLANINPVLQDTLAALQHTPITSAELERAKTQLRAYFILSNQDIASQALQLGFNQTILSDYRYSDRYLDAITRVTAADIQRVAQAYLEPEQQTTGWFEPLLEADQPASSRRNAAPPAEVLSPGAPVDPADVARYLPPLTPDAATTPQPLPESVLLPNGLQVLLLADHGIPAVNLSGWIQAGSAFDSIPQAGLARLTAANLKNGTQRHDALSLATILEDRGADLNFTANREGVWVDGVALSEQLPTLVETLADVLQQATFPDDQLELSRQRALISLRSAMDDPRQLGLQVFQQTVYPQEHPFHAFPTEASLTGLTRADVVRFYQTHYRPDATVLTLVGDFDPAQVRSLLAKVFGNWQAQGPKPSLNFPRVRLPSSLAYLSRSLPGKSEAISYLGYNGISHRDPRYYAALVMNQILGGDTLASRLGNELRDRLGLTYGIYSDFQAGIYPGPFVISMQTSPDDADQAIDSTMALLNQLRDQGVLAEELETAKRSLISSYPVGLSDPPELARTILNNAITGLPLEELRQFPERVESVTMRQVQQAIADFIHPDRLVIVTVGPEATEPS